MGKFQGTLVKKNIVRTCYTCLIMSVIILLAIIIISAFDLSFLVGGTSLTLGILAEGYFVIYFFLTYFTVKNKYRDYYERLINFFWGGFLCIFTILATAACTSSISVMLCWIAIMAFAMVPIYDTNSFLIFLGSNFLLSLIPIFYHSYTYDQILFVLAFNACAIILSRKLFDEALTSLRYRTSLDNAKSAADTDPMTGLLNRRGLDRKLSAIWPYCTRQNTDIAVIMLDIDFFKSYNDTFGHPEGDNCIKAIAGAIAEEVRRKTDIAARVGGEEFLIVLTGIDSAGALRWTASLKKNIEALQIKHAPNNFLPYVTVSMGLTTGEATAERTFQSFTDDADKALYHAKQNGRACVSFNKRIYGKHHAQTAELKAGER